jgi:hypothetical protein
MAYAILLANRLQWLTDADFAGMTRNKTLMILHLPDVRVGERDTIRRLIVKYDLKLDDREPDRENVVSWIFKELFKNYTTKSSYSDYLSDNIVYRTISGKDYEKIKIVLDHYRVHLLSAGKLNTVALWEQLSYYDDDIVENKKLIVHILKGWADIFEPARILDILSADMGRDSSMVDDLLTIVDVNKIPINPQFMAAIFKRARPKSVISRIIQMGRINVDVSELIKYWDEREIAKVFKSLIRIAKNCK